MNREMKFRAWEPPRYFDDGDLMQEGEMIKSKLLDLKRGVAFGFEADSDWDLKEYVFMHYTGLKDKDGQDVYEGDICKIDHQDARYPIVYGVISWDESQACWDVGCGAASEVNWSHKVIGNIYENPELVHLVKDE